MVVLDPRTGEILALANYPTFDPRVEKPTTREEMEARLKAWMERTGDSWSYNWSEPIEGGSLHKHRPFRTIQEYLDWEKETRGQQRARPDYSDLVFCVATSTGRAPSGKPAGTVATKRDPWPGADFTSMAPP